MEWKATAGSIVVPIVRARQAFLRWLTRRRSRQSQYLHEDVARIAVVEQSMEEGSMASIKQRNAAKKNIKKAASAAKKKRTIAHLPKSVRTALGKQAASVAKKKRKSRNKA
jgi:hypothetical protein